jgi:hypothetical protein
MYSTTSSSQYWTLNVMEFPFESATLEYAGSVLLYGVKMLPLDPDIRSEDSENITLSRWAVL